MYITAILLAIAFALGSASGFKGAKLLYDIEGLRTKITISEARANQCIEEKRQTDSLLENGRVLNEKLNSNNKSLQQRLEDFLNSAEEPKDEPKNDKASVSTTTRSTGYCITPSRMRDIERLRQATPIYTDPRSTVRN